MPSISYFTRLLRGEGAGPLVIPAYVLNTKGSPSCWLSVKCLIYWSTEHRDQTISSQSSLCALQYKSMRHLLFCVPRSSSWDWVPIEALFGGVVRRARAASIHKRVVRDETHAWCRSHAPGGGPTWGLQNDLSARCFPHALPLAPHHPISHHPQGPISYPRSIY
jgi:hypothetical protein